MSLVLPYLDTLASVLGGYVYRVQNEAQLQNMVAAALASQGVQYEREVRAGRAGRYDLLARFDAACVVLELKVKGSVSAVERQAQRYALRGDTNAVCVVTISNRLIRGLSGTAVLGGKPFKVLALRTL